MTYHLPPNNRRSIRLKGYDYSKKGMYFITLCIEDRFHLFGEIEDGTLKLNTFGEIAIEEWLKTIQLRNNIRLYEFIVMPNHFHAIIEIAFSKNRNKEPESATFKSPSQTIGAIIRGFKGATTKRIKEIIYREREESKEEPKEEFIDSFLDSSRCTGVLQYAPAPTPIPIIKNLNLSKSIWQRNYYEIIIRDEQAFINISNYIKNNPKNWKKDKLKK